MEYKIGARTDVALVEPKSIPLSSPECAVFAAIFNAPLTGALGGGAAYGAGGWSVGR